MSEDMKIGYSEFLRTFEVIPDDKMTVFLGAGASIGAGIPSAGSLVWEFKRKLYCSTLGIREEKFKDVESESNRRVLQDHFDSSGGYPTRGAPHEYSFYFDKCYPNPRDRKLFVQRKVENRQPSLGHLCLGALIASYKVRDIWTTNFDSLVEAGIDRVQSGLSYTVFSPENAGRIIDVHSSYPRILKLHGDYRYDPLQNTSTETQKLESLLLEEFTDTHHRKGIIVVGYSGNDESVRAVMKAVVSSHGFPYGLVWCIRKGEKAGPDILGLMAQARDANPGSGFVEIANFDDFLHDLYAICELHCPVIDTLAERLFTKRRAFHARQASEAFPPIRLNALPVKELPQSVYECETDLQGWRELRELTKGTDVIAALSKGKTYCFGSVADIKSVFAKRMRSEITITDVQDRWLRYDRTFYLGMLYDLVTRSFTKQLNLAQSQPEHRFYDPRSEIRHKLLPIGYKAYDAIDVHLVFVADALHLTLTPTVEIMSSGDAKGERRARQTLINGLTAEWYNHVYDSKLKVWLTRLRVLGDPVSIQLDRFSLRVDPKWVFAGRRTSMAVECFEGTFETPEPKLQFHVTEDYCTSIHPLQGLADFGPLDFSYGNHQHSPSIRIGIISPKSKYQVLMRHLSQLKSVLQPKSEKEYLRDFPGFDKVFRRYIDLPAGPNDKLVVTYDDANMTLRDPVEFYDMLKAKIDYFFSLRGECDLLLLYIPRELERFRELKNESVYFDLHDSIKLYCAKRQTKVQIIEDKSIDYFDQCKVKWWLSLGIHAKANGVPWKLSSEHSSTAFVGLGYAVRGGLTNRIVMGCSQMFDSAGQGMRFMLQQVNNPTYRGKNPFMSKEDARRIVAGLKEAYCGIDPNARLDRLVIHKTTHFTSEEMEGIALATEGIPQVELLQIQQDNPWRGIRKSEWKREAHGFPVKRGTTIQLDEYTFLLWTHGSVCDETLAGRNRNYYQGKRGIPIPLVVRRFRGEDPIEVVAREILGLTKMNWNGAELYKKLPVTIDFSRRLSQMAKQMETLYNQPYDFRYFI